jgi:saxitoxin biosynthesis operon SxtJ-like protein
MSLEKQKSRVVELETLAVLALFCLVLQLITHRQFFVYLAGALLVTALFIKPLAGRVARTWLKLAETVGTFNSRVILSAVFFLFLTPIAFLYRMFSGDPLKLRRDDKAASFYCERNHTFTKADLEKLW